MIYLPWYDNFDELTSPSDEKAIAHLQDAEVRGRAYLRFEYRRSQLRQLSNHNSNIQLYYYGPNILNFPIWI
jgi:hypothetical protein